MKILIVEDDPEMGRLIDRGLTAEGYETVVVDNGIDALIAVAHDDFALAAIDVMLPQMSGFEICRRIRETGSSLPILLLTARDAVEDRVYGLDSGADDYLTKPFAFIELSARIRALLRRDAATEKLSITVGNLTIDSLALTVTADGRPLSLSPKEFTLLRLLAGNAGSTVTRPTILQEVWGSADNIDPNIVDQYVSYLRRKLDAERTGVRITTTRGTGYALEVVE
ncbi:response regulator transcription factor [Lacisediminihabitans profunda]|uniref:Response regulator transcription factor n=1 Tax=Lacisediminihabitans profunda TaxID=2594790 RepID=A0A5C8UUI8_9MICO|nr:response regulator transcription factor [Lacisediminihabitans profunda]TXN31981.1 response regulator transcription factor [Lacisediminihabitans profunda]